MSVETENLQAAVEALFLKWEEDNGLSVTYPSGFVLAVEGISYGEEADERVEQLMIYSMASTTQGIGLATRLLERLKEYGT